LVLEGAKNGGRPGNDLHLALVTALAGWTAPIAPLHSTISVASLRPTRRERPACWPDRILVQHTQSLVQGNGRKTIAAKLTKRPPEAFDSWLLSKKDYYRDPNMVPNIEALQANVSMQKELGFLKTGLDIKAHSDLSIV
jgi:hypothetical protein